MIFYKVRNKSTGRWHMKGTRTSKRTGKVWQRPGDLKAHLRCATGNLPLRLPDDLGEREAIQQKLADVEVVAYPDAQRPITVSAYEFLYGMRILAWCPVEASLSFELVSVLGGRDG